MGIATWHKDSERFICISDMKKMALFGSFCELFIYKKGKVK